MNVRSITGRVKYCGVNDRSKTLFENLWQMPLGVSYNSYMVQGSAASALIDGCEVAHDNDYSARVLEALDGATPDFLVVNHVEPDHTGAVPMLHCLFPDMKIVGNAKTVDMLKGFYGLPDDCFRTVADGESLSLGDITLRFFLTPMVHWPETMVTYIPEEGVLFSGDAFGCFGALDGAVTDDAMDGIDRYFDEAYRYYGCIVAKYGRFVQNAIKKCSALDIKIICSTHGPVWRANVSRIVEQYSRMAAWEADKGVVIAYGSMYGHTAEMAEELAAKLAERGVRTIRLHDLSYAAKGSVLADVMRYGTLVVASPTYNGELFPPVAAFVSALVERGIENRIVGVMGSYTWGPMAAKKLAAAFEGTKVNLLAPAPVLKQNLIADAESEITALADAIVSAL